jgi:L-alanine-DL-glutamate epimerase-like enolase superfamily enzyme
MKIIKAETILLQIPYDIGGGERNIAGQPATGLNVLLLRVETDEGLIGWGEAFGHAVAPATKVILDTMIIPQLIGRDSSHIDAIMQDLTQALHLFGRNGPVVYALSGVDIALWDIAGKRANLPLYKLLGGGFRDELEVYASLLRYGNADTLAANVHRAVAMGYHSIKLHEIEPELVRISREAMGPDRRLMVDTNCPWTVPEALEKARAMQPYNVAWLEEPVWRPEDHHSLAAVKKHGIIPLSAGENAGGLHAFRCLIEHDAIDIAQPSVTKVGGITEVRKIIALCEASGVQVVPHCAYFGPGYMASMHIAASLPNDAPLERLFMDLEASPFPPYTDPVGGRVKMPQGPGLGCDPDPAVIARYRTTQGGGR